MAILAMVIARANGSKTAKPSDFMPEFDQGPKVQPPGQLLAKFRQYTKLYNRTAGS